MGMSAEQTHQLNGFDAAELVSNKLVTPPPTPPLKSHERFVPRTLGVVAVERAYDHLSDDEVYQQYIKPVRPVTDAKNIWAYWNGGWDKIPGWRQRVSIDWIRRQGPGWQLRILDSVQGSPWNLNEWLPAHYFPQCYHNGSILRDDPHGVQHVSDFVRTALLVEYGGAWIDIDLVLQRNIEDICWRQISDPNDPMEVCAGIQTDDQGPNAIWNSFVAAMPGNPFMRHWSRTYLAMWPDGVTSAIGIHAHPLMYNYPQFPVADNWRASLGDDLTAGALNDYLSQLITGSRLMCIAEPFPGGWDGPAYARAHMRLLSLYEFFPLNQMWDTVTGFPEHRQYELFKLPRLADPAARQSSAEQRDAERLCEGMLSGATFIKRGSGLHKLPSVARLWTTDPGSDCIPGSWGEYLRWARVHIDQIHRAPKLWVAGERNFNTGVRTAWRVGLLEPVTEATEKFIVEP